MELCPVHCVNIGCKDLTFLEKHESFVLTIVASTSAIISMAFTYFLKSRCVNIDFCCIKCNRQPITSDELNSVAVID